MQQRLAVRPAAAVGPAVAIELVVATQPPVEAVVVRVLRSTAGDVEEVVLARPVWRDARGAADATPLAVCVDATFLSVRLLSVVGAHLVTRLGTVPGFIATDGASDKINLASVDVHTSSIL